VYESFLTGSIRFPHFHSLSFSSSGEKNWVEINVPQLYIVLSRNENVFLSEL
jgi:hypothetical protein